VTRELNGRTELLVFEHEDYPHLGIQVPAGRLEPGDDLETGLLRKVAAREPDARTVASASSPA
jgi:8-oxo-dGTP diphosphatase